MLCKACLMLSQARQQARERASKHDGSEPPEWCGYEQGGLVCICIQSQPLLYWYGCVDGRARPKPLYFIWPAAAPSAAALARESGARRAAGSLGIRFAIHCSEACVGKARHPVRTTGGGMCRPVCVQGVICRVCARTWGCCLVQSKVCVCVFWVGWGRLQLARLSGSQSAHGKTQSELEIRGDFLGWPSFRGIQGVAWHISVCCLQGGSG